MLRWVMDLVRNWHDNGPGAELASVRDLSASKDYSHSQQEDLRMKSVGLALHVN
jgi:hypothetical protein